MINELITPKVLQPTPLKKNLVPRFEAKTRRGETRLHFVDQDLHKRLHDSILNHTRIYGYMVQSDLIQPRLNLEGEIEEGNGETAGR